MTPMKRECPACEGRLIPCDECLFRMNFFPMASVRVRGVVGEVGKLHQMSGLRWRVPEYDPLGRYVGSRESSGAFYDDCEDHPEGAIAWGVDCLVRFLEGAVSS